MNASHHFTLIESVEGQTSMTLLGSTLLQIDDGEGTEVRITAGTVWITLQHDTRDVILNVGESFVIDRDGAALISAFAPVTVVLTGRPASETPAPEPSLVRALVRRIRDAVVTMPGHARPAS